MNQAYKAGQSQLNNELFHPDENDTHSSSSIEQNNNTTTDEPDVKIIIIGDSAVGKSKLLERYLVIRCRSRGRKYCKTCLSTYPHLLQNPKPVPPAAARASRDVTPSL